MSSAFRHCGVGGGGEKRAQPFSPSETHLLIIARAHLLSYSRTLQLLSPDRCCGAWKQTRSPLFREKYTAKEGRAFQTFGVLFIRPQTSSGVALSLPWPWCVCWPLGALVVSPQSEPSQRIWWHSRNAHQHLVPSGGPPCWSGEKGGNSF